MSEPQIFERTVTKPISREVQRITVMIAPSADAGPAKVAFFNHSHADLGALGVQLPADSDPQAFVNDLLDAYQSPLTLTGFIFGWWASAVDKHGAVASGEASQELERVLRPTVEA